MILSIIVAASENNVIGRDNSLIWHLSADLKRFKALTTGNTVVMGRKTFESIGKALPNRRNIVISRNPEFVAEGCEVVRSVESALEIAQDDPQVFVIGGGSIYRKLWDRANRLYLTQVHTDVEGDTFIPAVDVAVWREIKREFHWADEKNEFNYSFIDYQRESSRLSLSVVLSSCNQPEWLEKTLWGYEAQTVKDFELIVADDGSRKETYDMLETVVPQLSYPVKHVWHEDKGFRKCDILNKGILACATDYLLFSDGDCIPRNDFVETHLKYRQKGRFLSGGYHKLDMDISKGITKEDILAGRCFDVKWLMAKGMPATFKNNKFTASGFKEWLLNRFTPTGATWNGHNASGWLSDILATNGFDERMQYGGQDREFGERLENRGVHGIQIRYSSVCIHLDHSRGYKTPESIAKNLDIRKATRKNKVKRTPFGIVKK